ncbi:hypothetical protein GCM10017710_24120 [Arthrobacter ramosus]
MGTLLFEALPSRVMSNQPLAQTSLAEAGKFFTTLASEPLFPVTCICAAQAGELEIADCTVAVASPNWVTVVHLLKSLVSKLSARTTVPGSALVGAGAVGLQGDVLA